MKAILNYLPYFLQKNHSLFLFSLYVSFIDFFQCHQQGAVIPHQCMFYFVCLSDSKEHNGNKLPSMTKDDITSCMTLHQIPSCDSPFTFNKNINILLASFHADSSCTTNMKYIGNVYVALFQAFHLMPHTTGTPGDTHIHIMELLHNVCS